MHIKKDEKVRDADQIYQAIETDNVNLTNMVKESFK